MSRVCDVPHPRAPGRPAVVARRPGRPERECVFRVDARRSASERARMIANTMKPVVAQPIQSSSRHDMDYRRSVRNLISW